MQWLVIGLGLIASGLLLKLSEENRSLPAKREDGESQKPDSSQALRKSPASRKNKPKPEKKREKKAGESTEQTSKPHYETIIEPHSEPVLLSSEALNDSDIDLTSDSTSSTIETLSAIIEPMDEPPPMPSVESLGKPVTKGEQ